MRRSTNSRVPALQICPELANTAMPAPGTAVSRSASAKTMSGDLPPSSSDTLQGLEPQTTYYYRVTSEDSTGQSDGVEGPVSHFITPPPGEVINNFPQPK